MCNLIITTIKTMANAISTDHKLIVTPKNIAMRIFHSNIKNRVAATKVATHPMFLVAISCALSGSEVINAN